MTDPILIVSITAAILAAAAFAVASVQAILTYVSWGPKHKCTFSAIGHTSKQVTTTWLGFSSSYPRVRYPLLNMDWSGIMKLVVYTASEESITGVMEDIVRHKPQWFWRAIQIDDKIGWWNVADDLDVLCSRSNPPQGQNAIEEKVFFGQLNIWEKLTFLGYRWGHFSFSKERPFLNYHHGHAYRQLQRPKASWAQLLLALGIRDTKSLRLRMVDADGVSDAIDAPIQRISLKSLGMLAHLLGFTSVSINFAEREFLALSPRGTISTIDISTLGKVVHFQGDILHFHSLISRNDAFWLSPAADYIRGSICFGKYRGNGLCLSLETLVQALGERWTSAKFAEESRKYTLQNLQRFLAGPVWREASTMTTILKRLNKAKHSTNGAHTDEVKSNLKVDLTIVMVEADLLKVHSEAYPHVDSNHEQSKADLESIMKFGIAKWQKTTRLIAPSMYVSATFLTFSGIVCGFPTRALIKDLLPWMRWRARLLYDRRREIVKVSPALGRAIDAGSLGFAREVGDYLMSRGGGTLAGLFGWGIMNFQGFFDKCDQDVRDDINPDSSKWDVQAITISETCNLLKNFDVQEWATQVKEIQRQSVPLFDPLNLLWIQVSLIDISIQFLIRGSWNFTNDGVDANQVPGVSSPNDSTHLPILDQQMSTEPAAIGQATNSVPDNATPPPLTSVTPTLAQRPEAKVSPEDPTGASTENGPTQNDVSAPARGKSITIQEPPTPPTTQRPDAPKRTMSSSSRLPQSPYSLPLSEPSKPASRSKGVEIEMEQIPNPRVAKPPAEDNHGLLYGEWGVMEARVVSAIVQSRRMGSSTSTPTLQRSDPLDEGPEEGETPDDGPDMPKNEPRDWPLAGVLKAFSGLTFGTEDVTIQEAKFQKLADLLELRALFVIAFFMLHPDSTDVYSIEGEDIELPIV